VYPFYARCNCFIDHFSNPTEICGQDARTDVQLSLPLTYPSGGGFSILHLTNGRFKDPLQKEMGAQER
jgi:hypothetical protein